MITAQLKLNISPQIFNCTRDWQIGITSVCNTLLDAYRPAYVCIYNKIGAFIPHTMLHDDCMYWSSFEYKTVFAENMFMYVYVICRILLLYMYTLIWKKLSAWRLYKCTYLCPYVYMWTWPATVVANATCYLNIILRK